MVAAPRLVIESNSAMVLPASATASGRRESRRTSSTWRPCMSNVTTLVAAPRSRGPIVQPGPTTTSRRRPLMANSACAAGREPPLNACGGFAAVSGRQLRGKFTGSSFPLAWPASSAWPTSIAIRPPPVATSESVPPRSSERGTPPGDNASRPALSCQISVPPLSTGPATKIGEPAACRHYSRAPRPKPRQEQPRKPSTQRRQDGPAAAARASLAPTTRRCTQASSSSQAFDNSYIGAEAPSKSTRSFESPWINQRTRKCRK